jgi:predicted DNA-binding transcriptional regulator YafY
MIGAWRLGKSDYVTQSGKIPKEQFKISGRLETQDLGFRSGSPWRPLRLGVRRLDDFMRHSFKVIHDELYTVRVRISPDWARWVGEKIWHESQKITKLPNGGLEMTFRVAGLDEIKRWILSFGPEAQVLEPLSLRQMVCADLQRSLT